MKQRRKPQINKVSCQDIVSNLTNREDLAELGVLLQSNTLSKCGKCNQILWWRLLYD